MNNASLVGRLVKDPEIRYTANNTAVAGFTLAVNRRFKQEGQPDADFLPVVAWQKTAEFCGKYFKKGQQVWINGMMQTRNYDDKDGIKRYVTEVVAEQVGFADSKKEDNEQAVQPQQSAQQTPKSQTPPAENKQQPPQGGQQQGKMPWEN